MEIGLYWLRALTNKTAVLALYSWLPRRIYNISQTADIKSSVQTVPQSSVAFYHRIQQQTQMTFVVSCHIFRPILRWLTFIGFLVFDFSQIFSIPRGRLDWLASSTLRIKHFVTCYHRIQQRNVRRQYLDSSRRKRSQIATLRTGTWSTASLTSKPPGDNTLPCYRLHTVFYSSEQQSCIDIGKLDVHSVV